MLTQTKIAEVMTRELITVHVDQLVRKIDQLFKENSIHHIPVVDDEGQLVGIVSKQDYSQVLDTFTGYKTQRAIQNNEKLFDAMTAEDIMTKAVAHLGPEDTLGQAMGIFRENLFHAIPILDKNNKQLVGILSTYDLLVHAYQEPTALN